VGTVTSVKGCMGGSLWISNCTPLHVAVVLLNYR